MTDKEIMLMFYCKWIWEECTPEEREAVKNARGKMNKARSAYLEHIKKKKGR